MPDEQYPQSANTGEDVGPVTIVDGPASKETMGHRPV